MSSNNNANHNGQLPIPFGTHVVGPIFSDDQSNNNRLDGQPGATNLPAPSGTHAQQHNLHTLNAPVTTLGPTGGDQNLKLKEEVKKLQADLERSNPHASQQIGNNNPVSQNQQFDQNDHASTPFSSQQAHTGLGTNVPGGAVSEPYATTTVGGTNVTASENISGKPWLSQPTDQQYNQGSNPLVPGSVLGHPKVTHERVDHSKPAQTGVDVDHDRATRKRDEFEGRGNHASATGNHGSTGFNTSLHGPTSGTSTTDNPYHTGLNTSNHGQSHTGPLGVSGATGARHGTGFDSTSHRQTVGGLTSTSGKKDATGNFLGHDKQAYDTGNTTHKHASDHESAGHKPNFGDKIVGMAEKVQGKVTGNPALVNKGELRGQGNEPRN